MSVRKVVESPIAQGADERIAYSFDFTNWGTPTTPTVTIIDIDTGSSVSSTCLTGTASIAGNTVITPIVHTLEAEHRYKLTCKVVIGANTQSAYVEIVGE